ncbi:MAG TPA: phosphatase PAP2 family protein [Armatimonadota bacterium]|jgi:membrane-associated phospholipid phosphatase
MKTTWLIAAFAATVSTSVGAQEASDALPYRPSAAPPTTVQHDARPSSRVIVSGGVTVGNPNMPERPLANPFKTFAELNRHGDDILRKRSTLPYLALGIAALATDKQTIKWFHPTANGEQRSTFAKTFSSIGAEGVAGTTLVLLVAGGRHEKDTGKLLLAAVGNSTVLTQTLKYLTGKVRPESSDNAPRYHPLSGFKNNSFPSGHTSASVAAAVVLGHQYPRLRYVFYGLAAGVGVARIEGHNHFPSDVYWGAGVGYYGARQALRYRDSIVTWRF